MTPAEWANSYAANPVERVRLEIAFRRAITEAVDTAALREAHAAMKMADDANWGEFCGCCGVLLSLEAQDEDCGQAHTAAQLIHAWLERYPEAP